MTWAHRPLQDELEHHCPKAHFGCTDKKHFIKQMAKIKWQEICIHHVQAKLCMPIKVKNSNTTGKALKHCYHIGESENTYEHIGTFLRNNAGDPTVKVSF